MFRMFPLIFLLTSWIRLLPIRGLDQFDPEEVEYLNFNVSATAGASVRLGCGTEPPSIFIWGFTRSGWDSSVALAYDYGRGPKVEALPGAAGRIRVPANTSALEVDEVRREAAGTYTCQALYKGHADRVTFYYTRLDVEDD